MRRTIRIHKPPKELLRLGEWFPLANAYVDHLMAQLGPVDFMVFLAVKRFLHGFQRSRGRVSQQQIIETTRLSRRTVQRSLQRLIEGGHFEILNPGTGRRATEYGICEGKTINIQDEGRGVTNTPLREGDDVVASEIRPWGVSVTPLGGQPDAPTRTSKDIEKHIEKNMGEDSIVPFPSNQLFKQWPAIKADMRGQTTEATFGRYLANLEPIPNNDGHVILAVRSTFEQEWISARLLPIVLRALKTYFDPDLRGEQIQIVVTGHAPVSSTEEAVIENPMEQPAEV